MMPISEKLKSWISEKLKFDYLENEKSSGKEFSKSLFLRCSLLDIKNKLGQM